MPVLLGETLEGLNLVGHGVYIDGTVGAGGHSAAILGRLTRCDCWGWMLTLPRWRSQGTG